MRTTPLALLLLSLLPLSTAAQSPRVALRGRGDPRLDVELRQLLRDSARQLWTADTTIARADTVRVPLLIVGATVRVEGTILSDVAAVGADLFIRPSARIHGHVRSFAGGWYASDRATVSGPLDHRPNAPYSVEHSDGTVVIRGTHQPRVLAFRPIAPGYDRVDGLSPGVGVRLLPPPVERIEPTLGAWASYHTERGQLDGGASATIARGRTTFAAGAERNTATNDDWIRGTLDNAVSYLWDGTDIRDYYEAERLWVELRRGLERGERATDVWLRGQVEDARSLRADEPWTVFAPDSLRPNRPIDEGRVASVLAGGTVSLRRPTLVSSLEASAEFALDAMDGDFSFAAYRLDLDWAMPGFGDHTLEIEAHARGPLPLFDEGCTDCRGPARRIPRQRWSHVGGSRTLHTFADAAFQGDRLVFVESSYGIPLGRRLRLPLLGIPSFEVVHATGMAWTRTQRRSFAHNVGFRLRYNVLYLRFMANPDDFTGDVEFGVGVGGFANRGYPWQPPGGFF